MKILSVIVLFVCVLSQCNTLYEGGAISNYLCMKYCSDEKLKAKAKYNHENKIEYKTVVSEDSEKQLKIIKTYIGKTKKDIILEIGVPAKIDKFNELDIFYYVYNYSSKLDGYTLTNKQLDPSELLKERKKNISSTKLNFHESYDLIIAYFDNDQLIKVDYRKIR